MDNGLVLVNVGVIDSKDECLNPCCNGRWSLTRRHPSHSNQCTSVLILVVMEDGLVPPELSKEDFTKSLNPYCSGRWSRTIKASRDAEIKSS